MIRTLTIIGTRPEAIKMAPVIQELQRYPDRITSRVCVSAQHREMLDQILDLFDIVPDVDLDLMQPNQSPSQVAAGVLDRIIVVYQEEMPDWVLVQGDTTTVMAAAIAAYHCRIRIAHIEAGLRTYDKWQPFPEEMNRFITDHISDLHFAPTERARENLLREGIPAASIHLTGNTVIDALLEIASHSWEPPPGHPLYSLPSERHLLLVTAHRRENLGRPLQGICAALRYLVCRDDVCVVYPVHRNPRVREQVYRELGDVPGVILLPPVDYREMVYLMKRCSLILTDSGGVQEEAPAFGKPVLVLREVTERLAGIETGVARLVGTESERIVVEVKRLIDDPVVYASMAQVVNLYGNGHAAERIVSAICGDL